MPVGPEGDSLEDFPAPGFDRVEILDWNTEQAAAEAVVDPAHEGFLVFSLLGSGNHVGFSPENGCHQSGDVGREVLKVSGIEDQDRSGSRLGSTR